MIEKVSSAHAAVLPLAQQDLPGADGCHAVQTVFLLRLLLRQQRLLLAHHGTIIRDTGIKKSSLQKAIKVLKQRKLIAVYKHRNAYGYSNNEYHLLSLDNPEIYRDLAPEVDELPLFIGEDLSA